VPAFVAVAPDSVGPSATSEGGSKELVAFNLSIDAGGNAFVVKYQGKVEGDTITGTGAHPKIACKQAPTTEWLRSAAAIRETPVGRPAGLVYAAFWV
jgi:hypothetical protein